MASLLRRLVEHLREIFQDNMPVPIFGGLPYIPRWVEQDTASGEAAQHARADNDDDVSPARSDADADASGRS